MTNRRTATATLTGLGSFTGHHGGDYLIQADCDAQRKQERTWPGRISLARHAATYALTQAVTKAALYRVADHKQLQIPVGIAITTAVDAWLHRR